MTLFLTFLHLAIIFVFAYRVWKKQEILGKVFWPALAVKFVAGVALGLVYTYYYSVADTFDYFRDASKVAALALKDFPSYLELLFLNRLPEDLQLTFQEPRAFFLTKITSVFNILTNNNYWIIGLYFSLISFLASWNLVKIIARHIPAVTTAGVVAFLFLPSAVFWSSGLLKESLALSALYFLSAVFVKVWFRHRPGWMEWVIALIALLVFWNLKYYYVAVFMPVVVTSLVYRFVIARRLAFSPHIEILIWICILLVPLVLMSLLHPNFGSGRFLQVIVENNTGYNELSAPEDVVRFEDLRPTPWSILINAPWALFSGLFRPLFWEAGAIIQVLPGIENTILLLFFVTGSFRFRKYFSSPHRLLVFTLLAYVVILSVLITISAPNFGTLSRYRTGYLSFFVFIILCNHPVMQYLERSFPRLVRE